MEDMERQRSEDMSMAANEQTSGEQCETQSYTGALEYESHKTCKRAAQKYERKLPPRYSVASSQTTDKARESTEYKQHSTKKHTRGNIAAPGDEKLLPMKRENSY